MRIAAPTVPYDSYEEAPPQPKESPDPEPAGLEAFVESEQMKNAALEGLGQLTRLSIIADGSMVIIRRCSHLHLRGEATLSFDAIGHTS